MMSKAVVFPCILALFLFFGCVEEYKKLDAEAAKILGWEPAGQQPAEMGQQANRLNIPQQPSQESPSSQQGQPSASAGSYWTPWYDRDDASLSGDYETRKDLALPCTSPIGIECRTSAMYGSADYSQTGLVYACNIQEGGYCENAENNGRCLDMEVRFLCPPS